MATLILMRHASAVGDSPQGDRARVLTGGGNAQARKAGGYLASLDLNLQLVLRSPAERVAQTWQQTLLGAQGQLDGVRVEVDDRLYLASVGTLLHCLEPLGNHSAVLLLGHNPGLSDLALRLGHRGPLEVRQAMNRGFSPATVMTFRLDTWARLESDGAQVMAVQRG